MKLKHGNLTTKIRIKTYDGNGLFKEIGGMFKNGENLK